jgi:hypothetical protein
MQVCPIKANMKKRKTPLKLYGVTKTFKHKTLVNADELPVKSGALARPPHDIKMRRLMEALRKMADDKARRIEQDRNGQ